MKNYITLPCGCLITIGSHASTCITHSVELRKLKLENERQVQEIMAKFFERVDVSATGPRE